MKYSIDAGFISGIDDLIILGYENCFVPMGYNQWIKQDYQ